MKWLGCIIGGLALALSVACSDDISSIDPDGEGTQNNWLTFSAIVAFDKQIHHDSVTLTLLDSSLTEIRTYPMIPSTMLYYESYQTEPLRLPKTTPVPYVKITLHTSATIHGKKAKLLFSRFASVDEYAPALNIYTALAAKPIRRLMLSDSLSLDSATALAYAGIDDFFGIENYNFESGYFTNSPEYLLPYVYCRYFISDSIFYSDFHELEDAIDKGEWGDTLFRVRAADALMRYYDKSGWIGVRGIDSYANSSIYPIANFRENALGIESCSIERSGDTIAVANRRSEFYDSVLVCDYTGNNIMNPKIPYWRRINPDERKYGYCINGKETLTEKDSTFYLCSGNGWQEVNDMNTVLKSIYKECYRWNQQSICEFRGTPYICSSYLYIDSTYANMGYTEEKTGYAWMNDTAAINKYYPEGIPDTIVKVEYSEEP